MRSWLVLVPLLIGLWACAPAPQKSGKVAAAPQNLLWPPPPDLPRFEFETVLQSAADISPETDESRWKRALQGRPDTSDALVISKPSAIVSRNGRVYVAEPGARAITVFDAARKRLFRFGLREPNVLKRPQALALDDAGKVYVLDPQLKKVMIFDGMGLFLQAISLGRAFSNPVGIAVQGDGATVYVVDRGNVDQDDHKVVALAPDGTERFRLGPRGSGPGQFNIPLAAAVAPDGTLYVVDSGNFRIQAFDATGKFKLQFGGAGVGIGQFSRPRAISLDQDGNIYVSDGGFNNVQIFDAAGQLLMPLGRLSREPGPGNYALIAGIAIDETRRLYVVDHYFKKIEVFRWLSDEEAHKKAAASKLAAS
jgi:sugar lactone lactonase YvrE